MPILPASSITVVLPAHNEAANLRLGLPALFDALRSTGMAWEVVVVDDGSDDDTAAVVRGHARGEPRLRLVCHDQNQGYGAALRSGFRAAAGEVVGFLDADLQFDPREIRSLLDQAYDADIVCGYRAPRRDGLTRRLNAWAWGRLVRATFGVGVRDVNCAFKLFRRGLVANLTIRSDGAFVNTEILVRARAAGCVLREVPVTHFPRRSGRQSGARPRVIARALLELGQLRGELVGLRGQEGVERRGRGGSPWSLAAR